jgi:CheY-like chemotaxis protein
MATVLIVEDETNIRKFAAVNLAARGYDIVEVDNAQDGLKRLRDTQLALMILDVKMPGMSGLELLDALSQQPDIPAIPVIMITASEGAAAQALKSKYPYIAEVLMKPLSASQLVEIVSDVLKED